MGLLDDSFNTANLLANKRRDAAIAAAQLTPGRGAVALAASGRERLNQGVRGLLNIEEPEVANANKLKAILGRHTNITTSQTAIAAANDLMQNGFTEYAQKLMETSVSMRNSEAQIINANRVSGTTSDPNIILKRDQGMKASEYLAKQSMMPGYIDNLETKRQQLIAMKQQGWVSTDAYKNLQKDIDDEVDDNNAIEKSINDDVKEIANRWVKVGIPESERSIARMESLILKYVGADGTGNLPGINVVEQAQGNLLGSEEDAEVIQALAAIENALLKARSGAAVTEPEYKRFLKEVQAGFKDDAAVIRFIKDLRAAVEKEKESIKSGFRPQVQNRYFKQAGIPQEGSYQTYNSPEEVLNLPIGTYYYSPDGQLRQKKGNK